MDGLLSPASCLGVFASLHLPPKTCILYRVRFTYDYSRHLPPRSLVVAWSVRLVVSKILRPRQSPRDSLGGGAGLPQSVQTIAGRGSGVGAREGQPLRGQVDNGSRVKALRLPEAVDDSGQTLTNSKRRITNDHNLTLPPQPRPTRAHPRCPQDNDYPTNRPRTHPLCVHRSSGQAIRPRGRRLCPQLQSDCIDAFGRWKGGGQVSFGRRWNGGDKVRRKSKVAKAKVEELREAVYNRVKEWPEKMDYAQLDELALALGC